MPFSALARDLTLSRTKPLRKGRGQKKNVEPKNNKEDKIMMPVRRNQNWLPSIFNDFFGNEWVDKSNATAPAVNILETEDDFKVEVAAPGMTKQDFKVHINEDNELIISMEKKAENKEEDKKRKGTYLRREFSYSQFQQSLILPDNVEKEKIAAKVEHGVLTVEIPKKKEVHATPAARQIEIE